MIIHKFQQCYKFPYFITLPLDNHKNIVTTSLKTLPVKPSGTKPGQRKKKESNISILVLSPSYRHDYDFFNISIGRYLNFRIPMSYFNFFNVVKGKAFVNKSARLLHNRIC